MAMPSLSALVALGFGSQQVGLVSACCSGNYHVAYAGEHTWQWEDMFGIKCESKDGANCGARVENSDAFGVGDVAMKIQAAPGPGVVTSFYISNNGGLFDDRGGSWNEVDFEIMGGAVRDGGARTKIWTNFFTGSGTEHHGFVDVPFDATAGEHVYAIRTNMTHVQWLVDWHPIRTDDFTQWPDMVNAVATNSFKAYASVWGKSWADGEVGCKEFVDGMGKLNDNPNGFPIQATFVPTQGGAPGSIALFEAGNGSNTPEMPRSTMAVMAGLAALAMTAFASMLVVAHRRRQATSITADDQEPLAMASVALSEEEFDSI